MMKGVNLSFTATNKAAPAMNSFQKGLAGAKQQLDATAVANRRFSESLGGSTWRRQVQQAGMQISDFSVQIAGGQSAILAFTQNFPQFIQNFGAMGGILAAAITILGTLAFMASKSAGAVLEFSKQIEATNKSLDEYFTMLRAGSGIESDLFKAAEESLKLTSQTVKDLMSIAKIEAFNSVQNLAKSLADSSTEAGILAKAMLGTDRGVAGSIIGVDTMLRGHVGNWKAARKEVDVFINAVRGISEGANMNDMLASAFQARDIFKSNVDVTKEMTGEQIKFWKELSQTIQQLELMGAAVDATSKTGVAGISFMSEAVAKFNEARRKGNDEGQRLTETLQRETEMLRAVALFGNDSAIVTKMRADEERRVFDEMLNTLNASADVEGNLIAAFNASQDAKSATAAWAATMATVRAEVSAILSALSQLGGGVIDNAAKRAEIMALKQGKSISEAARAQQTFRKELELTARTQAAQARGGIVGFAQMQIINAERAQLQESLRLDGELEAARAAAREAAKAAKGGGKEKISKEVREARREAEKLRELMLDVGPELRAALENVDNLTLKTAESMKRTFEDVQQSISDSLSSSFRGLLDRTKSLGDAVNDILGSILDKVFDLIATPIFDGIAGSITGGLLKGLGIPGFANGTRSAPGGLARINERGGELAVLPGGTQVIPHDLSKRMVDRAAGSGMGQAMVEVNIINQSNANVKQRRQRGPDGRETVDVMISESIAGGRQDAALGQRVGARPQRIAR